MNVLEAVDQLGTVRDKIKVLGKVISKIDSDVDFKFEVQTLKEIKEEIMKEEKQLVDKLEKTQLTNLR